MRGVQLAESLHEVVGERIVVVDEQDHEQVAQPCFSGIGWALLALPLYLALAAAGSSFVRYSVGSGDVVPAAVLEIDHGLVVRIDRDDPADDAAKRFSSGRSD